MHARSSVVPPTGFDVVDAGGADGAVPAPPLASRDTLLYGAAMTIPTVSRGACLCGAVQFEIELPTKWVAHCHCTLCRRAHGAAYVTWASVPVAQFRLRSGEVDVVHYRSSANATRGFCRVCGSTMFFQSTRWAGEMHVALANMLDPVDRAPQVHAFYSDRASWVAVNDGLPRRGGVTGTEPLVD